MFSLSGLTVRPSASARRATPVCTASSSGFGSAGGQRKKSAKRSRPNRVLEEVSESQEEKAGPGVITRRASKPIGQYWFKLADMDAFKPGKATAVARTQTGRDLVLYQVGEAVYCSQAASTAYEFPLIDAKIEPNGADGPEIEVPLDGTRYNLRTGEVIEWCPKNNPLRAFLGAIKSVSTPKDLPVYDCVVTEADEIYVKLTKQ